jgi:hypothetical protein
MAGDKRLVWWDDGTDDETLYVRLRTGGFVPISFEHLHGMLSRRQMAGYRKRVITDTGYTTVVLPTDCTTVRITCLGAGGGGAGGVTGDASIARNGGGGGGSAAWTRVLCERSNLPTTLYVYVGTAGAGGAANNNGSAGGTSLVEIANSGFGGSGSVDRRYLVVYSAGGAGGVQATGGTAAAVSTQGNALWATGAAWRSIAGRAGSNGGSGAAGTSISPWNGTGSALEGGCGGGGHSTVSPFAGGGYSAAGPFSAVAGGTAGAPNGGAGTAGTYGGGPDGAITATTDRSELVWAYGGTGGGSSGLFSGTGGAGGAGAPGSGGGGGGSGVTSGGAGGAGGGGCVVIECW